MKLQNAIQTSPKHLKQLSAQGTITCQHGPAECAMNRVINCAQKLYPKQAQWFPFVNCLEAAAGPDIAAAAPQCAEGADLAWASVDKCASGEWTTLWVSSAAVFYYPAQNPATP